MRLNLIHDFCEVKKPLGRSVQNFLPKLFGFF